MDKYQILLTNDDGIQSPGLWAAAEVLSDLGFVTVAAPREQSSGMGRSLPSTSDGIIQTETMRVGGKDWTVYAVGGTPAQAVLHGILEIMPRKPDLVVSGINYGENVGTGVTISGTIGATLEGASHGIPGLAMSLQTDRSKHQSYSTEVDFSAAAWFTVLFARQLLEKHFPPDVDVLKVDVPSDASRETAWQVTRIAKQRYYIPVAPKRKSWTEPGMVDYEEAAILDGKDEDTDVYVLRVKKLVSVTPLSLDMTSRVDFVELNRFLRNGVVMKQKA
ncbi:MAG TPA: 5'/3'-nucleotidase SurE [Anaerolineales bacterium]|nr:5'/3'-nucleotidase SurE [Anaerolineales bacterium]